MSLHAVGTVLEAPPAKHLNILFGGETNEEDFRGDDCSGVRVLDRGLRGRGGQGSGSGGTRVFLGPRAGEHNPPAFFVTGTARGPARSPATPLPSAPGTSPRPAGTPAPHPPSFRSTVGAPGEVFRSMR